ncbi:MAG: vitamin K epoxide reductase family protein [Candidatus Pacebacteria bacterium]|nr:vitamin K epoxide reductase family protein [Candidatus Paceibacterota bacterium]
MNKNKKHKLNYIFLTLGLLGLLNSLYLSYARYMHVDLPCSITNGGCSVVAASPYAVMFGMPLAYLGVLFYLTILGLGILYLFKSNIKYIKETLLVVTTFGALDSLYFLYLQGFVINAFCIYCILSAIISFCLLVVVYSLFVNQKSKILPTNNMSK